MIRTSTELRQLVTHHVRALTIIADARGHALADGRTDDAEALRVATETLTGAVWDLVDERDALGDAYDQWATVIYVPDPQET